MALTHSEQALVEALKALPPNSVYDHAPKSEIVLGFRLFIDHGVRSVGWEGEGVLLLGLDEALPDTPEPVSVRIFLDGGALKFVCSIDGQSHERCSHVVCAIATVIRLLRPRAFGSTGEEPSYRARLEAGLFRLAPLPRESKIVSLGTFQAARREAPKIAVSREVTPFRVVVERSGEAFRAYIEQLKLKAPGWQDPAPLPREVAYLARNLQGQGGTSLLSLFLKRAGRRYPIFFRDGPRMSRIEWMGDARCDTWTEIDAQRDGVVLRKGCALAGDGDKTVLLIGDLFLSADHSGMGRVAGADGWHYWDVLYSACGGGDGARPREAAAFHVPVERFEAVQFFLKKQGIRRMLGSVRFMVQGLEAPVLQVRASGYRLTVTADKRGGFEIVPQCVTGDHVFLPSRRIPSFAAAVEQGQVPFAMRTKKRKPVLYEALFHALSAGSREAIDDALKEVLNERSFSRPQLATEARALVKKAIQAFTAEDTQLRLTREGWRITSTDKEKEKLLFLVPYRVFGPALYDRVAARGTPMTVRQEDLLSRLHLLHSLAAEAGIEVSFGGRPIEQVAWDFALDATGGTIDWFEIRPEIRCNGEAVPKEVWEQALRSKGVISRAGSIQLLDGRSLRTLSLVTRLWDGTKKTQGPREIASIPRLRIIDLFMLRKEGIAVRLSATDEAIMEALTRFRRIEERALPGRLQAELRQYQREGYHWLAFLYEHRFGACLADDMGLGKTIQAICLLAAVKEGKVALPSAGRPQREAHRFLVIVPPSLIFNWERELARFYPDLAVYVYKGKGRDAASDGYDVMITSYGLVLRDIARLRQVDFSVIVFDEAQAIKNIYADTTHAVRQLRGRFKVALTGTPVENHAGEYFSIMDLVLPGLLGDYREFQRRARGDLSELLPLVQERTGPFVLRRTKERILKELPPKVEHDVYLDLTEQQKRLYNRTVMEVRSAVDAAYRAKTAAQAKIIALTAIMKLRQICLAPQLLTGAANGPAPKVEFLKGKLEELCGESHSSLVFSQFTSFLDVVEEELRPLGLPLFRLDGSTPVRKRKEIVDGFQESADASVFLLSLKAGGQGLNLTRGSYVFHLDPWWNPAVENQASDRSHRIGQKNKVIVTRLLMRHSIEEKMMTLKQKKLGLYKALMDAPEKGGVGAVTREDFDFLLG